VATTDFAGLHRREPELFNRIATASMTRTWGDAFGYMMVATGRLEAMIDPIVSPWDVAPLPLIIEEAGGPYTDLNGIAQLSDSAVASNGQFHSSLLRR
jgi:fructose-1,6-bisphosphatase/inositol monophosphatase family enzyme